MNTERVAVLGSGSWGTALAIRLAQRRDTVLWSRDDAAARRLSAAGENTDYLPGHRFPVRLTVVSDLASALDGVHDIVVAVPSHALREVLTNAAPHAPGARYAIATKGFESGTGKLPHEVAAEVLGADASVAILSGPSFAGEVAADQPTAMTVATTDKAFADALAKSLHGPRFRVYFTDDLVGVEFGGAVKNVIAIATGLTDGLGFGANARAALITRGLAEIVRLGTALGGRSETFLGLTGIGDLVLTCTGSLSRNRQVGLEMGQGRALADVLSGLGHVAEGVKTAQSAVELARKLDVELPICEQVYRVLYEGKSPREAVHDVMTRPLKKESE